MVTHADGRQAGDGTAVPERPTAWWSRRAIGLHVTLAVVLPAFAGLFWWQVQRVRQGNTLSWAYVFEWPFFAGYAVYLWWHLVHDQPGPADADVARSLDAGRRDEEGVGATTADVGTVPQVAEPYGGKGPEADGPQGSSADGSEDGDGDGDGDGDDDERELAAYNRYLAELNASARRKRW